ncbi:MAG: hypothetical protein GX442_11725 [Candidatus Riflebacteria bacterium]|nr:hypothetical protein [Candidatus Riflebacteria bacterium]
MDVKPLPPGMLQGLDPTAKEARFRERFPGQVEPGTTPAAPVDVFEPSVTTPAEVPPTDETSDQSAQAGGLKISMNFDLFYQLSQKVTARMGQSGGQRFVELAGTVAETFQGSFSLSIDAVGSYLKGTDKSLEISPETTGEFFDAVEGLADLSPEALETFLKESGEFFEELESQYGDLGGVFDDLKKQVQDQASGFFQQVEASRQEMLAEVATPAPAEFPQAETGETPTAAGLGTGHNMVVAADYQKFLQNFLDYTRKFREQMLLGFFKSPARPPAATGPAAAPAEKTEPASPAVAAAAGPDDPLQAAALLEAANTATLLPAADGGEGEPGTGPFVPPPPPPSSTGS